MQPGDTFIVQTKNIIGTIKIIAETTNCLKIQYGNGWGGSGCQEWVYKTDFKSNHSYIDPKIKIIEQL